MLLLAGATLAASPTGPATRIPSPGGAFASSPHELLELAKASAAPGVGPWGIVAAPPPAPSGAAGPNLTFGVIMTYDAADGYVLAVSLNASAGPFNNSYGPYDLTWKFVGGNWSLVPTVGQVPATLSPGLVYDAHDNYVLLYGGRLMGTSAPAAPLTNQTWSYHAGAWTNLSANSTAAPYSVDFADLVYDASDEYVLLYDEFGVTPSNPNGFFGTTWSYASGVWTNLTTTAGTPPEWFGGMAYDALDGYVLYFGGYTFSNQLTDATWTFHGGAWSNISASVQTPPSARFNFGIAYDDANGRVLVYGGLDHLYWTNASAFSYETWAYAGGNWTLISSNGTVWSIQSMTYDVADSEAVLLGSNGSLLAPPNVVTWTFSSGGWSVAAPAFVRSSWVTDVGHPVTLSVSVSPNAGGLAYRYDGLPPGCATVDAPTLTCTPSLVGSYVVTVTVTGAAGFLATAGAELLVNPAPAVVGFSSRGPIGEVGVATSFVVTATSGTGALTYSYVGLPPGCASADTAQLTCTPSAPGTYAVAAYATDALGASAVGTTTFTVVAALTALSFAAHPSVVDVGQLVSIAATLAGGAGPFGYAYTGLPTGCTTANASSLACRPDATGAYSIGLVAGDALGRHAEGLAPVVVNALPSVASVVPSDTLVPTGTTVSLTTTVAGGTAPFEYQYSGLPTGCTGAGTPVVSCSAVPTGNYSIEVTVTDATGAFATGAATFSAAAPTVHVVPSVGPGVPGFWWGFGVALVAIAIAGVAGGYRIVLARQGEAIVRGLRAPSDGSDNGSSSEVAEGSTAMDSDP